MLLLSLCVNLFDSGDCGVYMLKTLEMLMAGKCNEEAQKYLNDKKILAVRRFYAVQLYASNADP